MAGKVGMWVGVSFLVLLTAGVITFLLEKIVDRFGWDAIILILFVVGIVTLIFLEAKNKKR